MVRHSSPDHDNRYFFKHVIGKREAGGGRREEGARIFSPVSSSLPPPPSSRSSNPELSQMMVHVAVREHAPRPRRHLPEHWMFGPLRPEIQFLERLDALAH